MTLLLSEEKIKFKMNTIVKKLVLAMCIFAVVSSSSCTKDDVVVPTSEKEYIDESSDSPRTKAGQLSTPNPNNFDEVYTVSLTNYQHINQNHTYGLCGPCSYVSAKSIRKSNYTPTYSEAQGIYNSLNQSHPNGWGVYQLSNWSDQTPKDFASWTAGNTMWGSGRDNLKAWIKTKISAGKPCVIPALYDMSTSTSTVGHFYVIVSLFLKNGGTGSVAGVKDVWSGSAATQYFDYSDLLSSNWVNAQKFSGVGSESYSVMSFE
jgi:hypothetical protein